MALAAPAAPTGYSAFWLHNNPQGYNLRFARSGHEYRAARALGAAGFRKYRAQMLALMGAAPGAAATDTHARITHTQPNQDAQNGGGRRTIGTVSNTTTTTGAMETAAEARVLNQIFNRSITSYPVDASGNGGGSKLGR